MISRIIFDMIFEVVCKMSNFLTKAPSGGIIKNYSSCSVILKLWFSKKGNKKGSSSVKGATFIKKVTQEEDWMEILPDCCDEKEALRVGPGGSRISLYLETISTEMK